jgi:DNA-3-methyladenine glycosylase II
MMPPEPVAAAASGGFAPCGLDEGIAALSRLDADFAAIVRVAGPPRFRRRPASFGTLLHIILEQQVSIDAAAAMYARLRRVCDPLDPACFLGLDVPTLRACGFSRQKAGYGRHLAEAMLAGRFDPAGLAGFDDEAATAALVGLKGIGRWSAEIYLLFALGRPDIWPAQDLGLQIGLQRLKSLPARPEAPTLRAIGEAWRPWRSVAACLIWQHYLHVSNRSAPTVVP